MQENVPGSVEGGRQQPGVHDERTVTAHGPALLRAPAGGGVARQTGVGQTCQVVPNVCTLVTCLFKSHVYR